MPDTLADVIAKDRERLHVEREMIYNQQQELETKLAEINREFAAIDAYEAAKIGKPTPTRATSRKAAPARASGARKGSKRDELVGIIKASDGLTRGEILEKMGLKGNKAGEMSVSNALTAMKKANQVRQNDAKKYIAV